MKTVTAIVAEDELVLRDELCGHLQALWPELTIAGLASNGIEALRLLERHRLDIAFLDIEMPGLSGLEVARQCQGHVVFVTAYDAHTRVVTRDGEALIRRSPKELQDELDPACFWPIHRSTIVNANAIAGVTRDIRGRVAVKLKSRAEKLPVSEAHEHLFKQM